MLKKFKDFAYQPLVYIGSNDSLEEGKFCIGT